jgi:hypoxanthine phosphoribosyltransferase
MKTRFGLLCTEIIMEVLLSREELSEGIDRLAHLVDGGRGEQRLVLVGVLTGSIMLVADLLRRLDGFIEVGMVSASSYRGLGTTPGKLDLHLDLLPDVSQKHVLLVDDIFDTGRTMTALVEAIYARGAASVKSLVLPAKKE